MLEPKERDTKEHLFLLFGLGHLKLIDLVRSSMCHVLFLNHMGCIVMMVRGAPHEAWVPHTETLVRGLCEVLLAVSWS